MSTSGISLYVDRKFAGTTVNERLYLSGLWDKFDSAVKEKDVEKATAILIEVELDAPNITSILKLHGLL